MADMDDLSDYLPGRSRKPDPPKPTAPRKPSGPVGAGLPTRPQKPPSPSRPGGKKPTEPTPPPQWRQYLNNPAVVAALFAMAVLAAVTQLPGAFRARPPYETHPCCSMRFYSCKCGCQATPSACTCPNHKVLNIALPPGMTLPQTGTPTPATPGP